jgi:hypothetical protein
VNFFLIRILVHPYSVNSEISKLVTVQFLLNQISNDELNKHMGMTRTRTTHIITEYNLLYSTMVP